MANPVFIFSLVYTSRRSWYRWVGRGYGCWLAGLVSVLFLMGWADSHFSWTLPVAVFERFARRFCELFLWQQAILLLVATPVFAAGSITDGKANGTLQHLLTTSLTSWEIILGKWLAQVVKVGLLAMIGLPLLVFFGGFLGLSPLLLVVIIADLGLQIGGLAAAGLLASVWCRRTLPAIFGTYLLLAPLGFFWAGLGTSGWLLFPAPSVGIWGPELVDQFQMRMVLLAGLGLLYLGLAAWQLRPAFIRQLERAGQARTGRTMRRPRVSNKPLRWKECYLGKWPLERFLDQTPWLGTLFLFWLTFLIGCILVLLLEYSLFVLGPILLVTLSWEAVVVASQSISGEREKQTWDLLLTTPLEPRQLVRGKVWGIMDRFRPLLWGYGSAALLVSLWAGLGEVLWTALWWGLTWLTIYFAAAVGLECSTRSSSSWRSLLAATISAALAVFLRLAFLGIPAAVAMPIILGCFFLGPLWLFPALVGFIILGAACLGTVLALLAEAEIRLERAEKWLREQDRVPQVQVPIWPVRLPPSQVVEQPLADI